MLRKIKEVEGQKSLDNFLKAVTKHTPTHEDIDTRSIKKTKKQTPPSAEREPVMKKLRSRR